MKPEERLKERQLHLKTKELNNEIQNDDLKNRFYVVRGPIWDIVGFIFIYCVCFVFRL